MLLAVLAFPHVSPAPLIYVPGEGWVYEAPGKEGRWHRMRAEDQLQVAQEAFESEDYGLSLKAARRTVKRWPLSDFAPQAQYLVARVYEARKHDEKAFNEYQRLLEKYPKVQNYEEVLQRQFDIATRFLNGQWFRLWGYIPIFPSMEKTTEMYRKLVKNGPYSDVAAQSQLNMAAASEKREDYAKAVKMYEKAADLYSDRKAVAAEALFKAGMAYYKQAKAAEYDQNAATQAIATFSDYVALHPEHAQVPEAQQIIAELKTEKARGAFQIAKFYEKSKRWHGARVYYNQVIDPIEGDPNSEYAEEARERLEIINRKLGLNTE
jgi:outer membrane protein assembly factor BamD (BamD/ComL family)